MRLNEIRQILASDGIRLTKSLGQNFMHDANQLHRMLRAAELAPGDRVLEIGPGLGPLTELLAAQAAQVLAIEIDRRLAEWLRHRLAAAANLELVHQDALDYLRREDRDWTDWKLVANLPYSVASPILVELARAAKGPARMVATVQIEVARRLAASPDTADYGLLTLLVQARYEPAGWFKIPAACFYPAPDVDSACVTLVRRPQSLLTPKQDETFVRIVKRSFSQRRKMMLKLLRADWPAEALDHAFRELQLSPQVRAEAVALEHYVQLARILCPPASPASPAT